MISRFVRVLFSFLLFPEQPWIIFFPLCDPLCCLLYFPFEDSLFSLSRSCLAVYVGFHEDMFVVFVLPCCYVECISFLFHAFPEEFFFFSFFFPVWPVCCHCQFYLPVWFRFFYLAVIVCVFGFCLRSSLIKSSQSSMFVSFGWVIVVLQLCAVFAGRCALYWGLIYVLFVFSWIQIYCAVLVIHHIS